MFRQCVVRLSTTARTGASDPVQQLFLDNLKSYTNKMKAAGGKLVDITPQQEKSFQDEMDRVAKTFRVASKKEAETFPTFQFSDPSLESIHLADAKK